MGADSDTTVSIDLGLLKRIASALGKLAGVSFLCGYALALITAVVLL